MFERKWNQFKATALNMSGEPLTINGVPQLAVLAAFTNKNYLKDWWLTEYMAYTAWLSVHAFAYMCH